MPSRRDTKSRRTDRTPDSGWSGGAAVKQARSDEECPGDLFQPRAGRGAKTAVEDVLRVATIKEDSLAFLGAHQGEGLVGGATVIKHQCHVGHCCGKPDGALRSWKSR